MISSAPNVATISSVTTSATRSVQPVLPAQGQAGTEAERDATETAEAVHKQDAKKTSAGGRTEKVFQCKERSKMIGHSPPCGRVCGDCQVEP
jgi:hypothetical protein